MKTWKVLCILAVAACLRLALGVSGAAVVNLIEGSATVTNGNELVSFNLLRSSSDSAVCKPYYDSTEEGDGTNIVNMLIGAAATGVTVGGIGHDRLEWFLDGGTCTNYALKVTSVADDNKVSVEMTWMEVSGI